MSMARNLLEIGARLFFMAVGVVIAIGVLALLSHLIGH